RCASRLRGLGPTPRHPSPHGRGILIQIIWMVGLLTLAFALPTRPALGATFVVNTAADGNDANPGDGVCETAPGNGVCTLRAAIQETNALAGADQIILPSLPPLDVSNPGGSPGAYILTIPAELTITDNLTITGGGAPTTIVDGNGSVRSRRVLSVVELLIEGTQFFRPVNVELSGVTIRNGVTDSGGGGISNDGTLTIINSTISGNRASTGGGLSNRAANRLTVIGSTVSGNSATG